MSSPIQSDLRKLKQLYMLLREYGDYIEEKQPLAAQLIGVLRCWVDDNIREIKP